MDEIAYSDGASDERRVLEILKGARAVGADAAIAPRLDESWPVRYHLTPERANLVRPFRWAGLDVLEIGAGMGAVSRFLAEQSRSLHVVEGTKPRYACLEERLRDLGNWTGRVGNFQDLSFDRRFDVACLLGVLEYSELFIRPPAGYGRSPFHWMLERARELVGQDGVLVLAIENALGLKYWNGAGEDHTGRLYDGICGYPLGHSPKTFSRRALLSMLSECGFPVVDEYYPFPDYKLASSVVSRELALRDPGLAGELAGIRRSEDYSGRWRPLFPESLAWENVAGAGLVGDLAPSFLFVAAPRRESAARRRLQAARIEEGEEGWHYSSPLRRIRTKTVFSSDGTVRKRALGDAEGPRPGASRFHWKSPPDAPKSQGPWVQQTLARAACFGEWERYFGEWGRFISWSFAKWGLSNGGETSVRGEALDAVIVNARASGEGYALFDLEWRAAEPFPKSWFIFRNVSLLERDLEIYTREAPFPTLAALYEELCRRHGVEPDFEGDLAREAEFRASAIEIGAEALAAGLRGVFETPFPPPRLARSPALEKARVDRDGSIRLTLDSLSEQVRSRVGERARRVPWLYQGLRGGYRAVKGVLRRS